MIPTRQFYSLLAKLILDRFFHEKDEREYSDTERLASKPLPRKLNAGDGHTQRDAFRLRIAYWSLSGHSPSKASHRISPVAVVKLTDEPQFRQLL